MAIVLRKRNRKISYTSTPFQRIKKLTKGGHFKPDQDKGIRSNKKLNRDSINETQDREESFVSTVQINDEVELNQTTIETNKTISLESRPNDVTNRPTHVSIDSLNSVLDELREQPTVTETEMLLNETRNNYILSTEKFLLSSELEVIRNSLIEQMSQNQALVADNL